MIRLPGLKRARLQPARLLGTAAAGADGPTASSDVAYVIGDPGRPAPVPTLLIALTDDSGSVTSPGGTDPLSNRYGEMAYAFRAVARRGSRRELGAVLHFDTPTSGDVAPTPLTWWNKWRLERGLGVPRDAAGTSQLTPSLRRAVAMAETHPGHAATLVVLSDFLLLDPDQGQVLAELAAFPGDVHAVVLGSHVSEGTLDDRITVTHIERDDPPGAVARALFISLVTHRPGSRPALSSS